MTAEAGKKPNIVFILSDDMGAWAMGCAGNKDIRTPHLDRLAAEGMRFTSFFCTSPVCSPARASLFTGRIPSQHGIHDWIREGNIGEDAAEYLAGQQAYTELLVDHGYICGMSGKWHLGDSIRPQKGFSHWYVHQSGGGSYYNAPMIRDGRPVEEPGYVTDLITDDAIAFLERQNAEQPFYLSVHYTAPHTPWINSHPQHIVDSYADCSFDSCPQLPKHPWQIKSEPYWDDRIENLKGYFAAITAMDENIGRIIAQIERMGLREQTLICFMSDNGYNCGHHGIWGKGNGTFPQNMFDTSVKVPAIFSHPTRIPQGAVNDQLVSGYDFMPTLLDFAGVPKPEDSTLPGTSFLTSLLGGSMAAHEHVVIFDEYGPVRMIRSKEWKYVHRYPYGPHELYHLQEDPDEQHNLIDLPEYKAKHEEMKAGLEQWFLQYVDPAMDGVRQEIYGFGQLTFVGPEGKGKKAFHHSD
ncbi:sulfatase-like hydrolase/transferase [Paenibacillus sp. GCM10027626]|uniref:sulfatase-like hydrolase/transferase n=1 Tax=Paenibacillus sp. GCM10027626 TaxID=3273411 RepID=UPI003626B8E3